jgi:prolyl oligopeptidase
MLHIPCALLLATAIDPAAVANQKAPLPETPKKPVVDTYQGVQVTDDYRWLEDAAAPAVKEWGDAETAHTRAFLDAVPFHDAVHARLDTLIRSTSERWLGLQKRGDLFIGGKLVPSKQQAFLVAYTNLDEKSSERVLVDPNVIDPTGKTAMDFWAIANDGKLVAVSLSKNGSEAGDLHIYDVATGKELPDVIPHVNNGTAGGSAAFAPDDSGFWYTRYPRGNERGPEDAGFYQQIYFHKLGTKTEDDTYELGKELPRIAEIQVQTKRDGKWVLAEVKNGDGGEVEFFVRPTAAGGAWTQVSTFKDKAVIGELGEDEALYVVSRNGAPRGKVLRIPLATPTIDKAAEIVKETSAAIEAIVPTTTILYVQDLLGGPSQVRLFDLATHKQWKKNLPILDVSSVHGLTQVSGDEVLYANESYTKPAAWFLFDPKSGAPHKTALFSTSVADYSDTEVSREFATSKDGTRVPMNILRKKGTKLNGLNQTILYAYGGYGVSMTPRFSAALDRAGRCLCHREHPRRRRIRRPVAPRREPPEEAERLRRLLRVRAVAGEAQVHVTRPARDHGRLQRRSSHGSSADAAPGDVQGRREPRRRL